MLSTYNQKLRKELKSTDVSLRAATPEDSRLLFEWANHPAVREMSLNKTKFSWQTHENWFKNRLESSLTQIFIALNAYNQPLGQIRFDLIDNSLAEVDVHTDPELTGIGLGTKIISLGTNHFFAIRDVISIRAIILQSNFASIKAFQKAGYQKTGEISIQENSVVELTATRCKQ